MSRSRVTEFVGELERSGFVTITRRGQGKTNLYKVHFNAQRKKETSRKANDQMSARRHQDVD